MRSSLHLCGISVLLLATVSAPGGEATPNAARRSVEKALPFLEKEGLAWLQNRKCIACHHGAYLIWSHREAARIGIAVDEKKLAAWTGQVLELFLKDKPKHVKYKGGTVESTSILLARGGL